MNIKALNKSQLKHEQKSQIILMKTVLASQFTHCIGILSTSSVNTRYTATGVMAQPITFPNACTKGYINQTTKGVEALQSS